MNKVMIFSLMCIVPLTLYGCCTAQIEKVQMGQEMSPQEIVVSLKNQNQKALVEQADLLSHKNYNKAQKWSLKTEKELSKNKIDMDNVLDAAGYSQAYYNVMFQEAALKRGPFKALLMSRRNALTAGVRNFPELFETLESIDEKVRDETNRFTKNIEADELKELQVKYLRLEVSGVQQAELSRPYFLVRKARQQGAKNKAAYTYKSALKTLTVAENAILATPRSPEKFAPQVLAARQACLKLSEVMSTIESNRIGGGDIEERVALQLVKSKRKIGVQDAKIATLYGNLESAENQLAKTETELYIKESELSKADRKLEGVSQNIKYQRAMDQFNKELKPSDGEIFQKGDSLVIRLKRINFQTGKKELPNSALPLIKRVSTIVDGVGAKKLSVKGHTDSTGDERFNRDLSVGRAEVVADYLRSQKLAQNIKAEGLGSSEPVASNETAQGRAQNRRVDIVIETN